MTDTDVTFLSVTYRLVNVTLSALLLLDFVCASILS